MEFCPEVAVLQSAFSLVQNKAGNKLAALSKPECPDSVLILKTTLEEICQGLEKDLEPQEQLLWQQSMHTLILYKLVKKVYKTEEKKDGMPVFSPLDALVQVFPNFSKHLYFELVKECSWGHFVIESLPYLDTPTGTQLLLDLIEHCSQEPVTNSDYVVMGKIRETVVEKLLMVPYEINSVLEKHLKPLSRPDVCIPHVRELPEELDILSVHEVKKVTEPVELGERYSSGKTEIVQESYLEKEPVKDVSDTEVDKQNQKEGKNEILDASKETVNKDTVNDTKQSATVNDTKQNAEICSGNSNVAQSFDAKVCITEKTADLNKGTDIELLVKDADCLYDRLFWHKVISENASVMEYLLKYTESLVTDVKTLADCLHFLAQVALVGYIKTEESPNYDLVGPGVVDELFAGRTENEINISYQWIIFNLFWEENPLETWDGIEIKSEFTCNSVFIVDQSLADELNRHFNTERWMTCLHQVLVCLKDKFCKIEQDPIAQTNDIDSNIGPTCTSNLNHSNFHVSNQSADSEVNDNAGESKVYIATGLCLNKDGLYRMIEGILSDIENKGSLENDTGKVKLEECQNILTMLQKTKVLYKDDGADSDPDLQVTDLRQGKIKSVECYGEDTTRTKLSSLDSKTSSMIGKFGNSWRSDFSIEALCWRIKHRLPYCQGCVEKLLEPQCRQVWQDERIYDAFSDNIQLLSTSERVLKLTERLKFIHLTTGNITPKAQQLFCAAFSGLSFMNQDMVAMKIYTERNTLSDWLCLEGLQVMTVFNRITVLRDDQILSELFLLCLVDPRNVLSTAVRMSVRNKEQATNLAQVLQFFQNICQSVHPSNHPDKTLLGHVISEFLLTTTLTEKEQTTFVVFLAVLLKAPDGQNKIPLLPPWELMEQSILPFVCVNNLQNNGPVSCTFALTMLKVVLENGCNRASDWKEFEPMELILCLAELLHQCVALWDSELEVSGQTKIAVKTLIHECLNLLDDLIAKEIMVLTGSTTVEAFYVCLKELDFHVVVWVRGTLGFLSMDEYNPDYQEALDQLLHHPDQHLSSILMILSFSEDTVMLPELTLAFNERSRQLNYDDVIAVLIQVLPNLMSCEFERAVKFMMSLIEEDLLPISYRLPNTQHFPLTGAKGCESTLGISQILRDVVITLAFLTDRNDMLQHVLQCYTACLKSLTSTATESFKPAADLFTISQLFQHVCDIVQVVPQQTVEPVLVLLLHLLTLFTDIHDSSQNWLRKEKWRTRLMDSMSAEIQSSVYNLPDSLVEKEMLRKKIMKVFE